MNLKIVLVVGLIFLFAVSSGGICYLVMGGPDLEAAYQNGKAEAVQKTQAGKIPHTVQVKNSWDRPVRVLSGTLLTGDGSGGLVIASTVTVPAGSSVEVPAYSTEPEKRTVPGSKLKPTGQAPGLIRDVISSSNPDNPDEAMKTQLKIWVLARGDKLDIYRGEVYAAVKKRDMRFYQLKERLEAVKAELKADYGLTDDELSAADINSPILNRSSPLRILSLIKTIYPGAGQ